MLKTKLHQLCQTLKQGVNSVSVYKTQKLFWRIGIGTLIGLFVSLLYWLGQETPPPEPQTKEDNIIYKGAVSALPREEVWVKRMEQSVKDMTSQKQIMDQELMLIKKQMEILHQTLNTWVESQTKQSVDSSSLSSRVGQGSASDTIHPTSDHLVPPVSTLGQITLDGSENNEALKTIDTWIPAGSFAQGVLVSGIVASTAVSSSSNPQPVVIRLLQDGTASRGWAVDLKDAYLIGACHGDLSAERAYCRLSTLSYTDPSGEVIEKDIEGWIVDADGRYGLFGPVVDRSDEVARQALVSGILGGIASFFSARSSQSVYPISPFGQTNALSTTDMLKGSASSGVGKALEKLADFAIKRAESMSPVILIDPGRTVDVVFKKGVTREADSQYTKTLKEHSDPIRYAQALTQAQKRFQNMQKQGRVS